MINYVEIANNYSVIPLKNAPNVQNTLYISVNRENVHKQQ